MQGTVRLPQGLGLNLEFQRRNASVANAPMPGIPHRVASKAFCTRADEACRTSGLHPRFAGPASVLPKGKARGSRQPLRDDPANVRRRDRSNFVRFVSPKTGPGIVEEKPSVRPSATRAGGGSPSPLHRRIGLQGALAGLAMVDDRLRIGLAERHAGLAVENDVDLVAPRLAQEVADVVAVDLHELGLDAVRPGGVGFDAVEEQRRRPRDDALLPRLCVAEGEGLAPDKVCQCLANSLVMSIPTHQPQYWQDGLRA